MNAHIEKRSERVTALNHAISSFLALHGETLPTESTAEQSSSESVSPFQSKLDRITQRLSKSAADATEATRLQSKLHALEDKEEEQLKKMLHLQAQVSSMQANMQKIDKSLQQTVSKEVELLDVIEERDDTIRRLEGNVSQVKASMEHLAGELKEAQSYVRPAVAGIDMIRVWTSQLTVVAFILMNNRQMSSKAFAAARRKSSMSSGAA